MRRGLVVFPGSNRVECVLTVPHFRWFWGRCIRLGGLSHFRRRYRIWPAFGRLGKNNPLHIFGQRILSSLQHSASEMAYTAACKLKIKFEFMEQRLYMNRKGPKNNIPFVSFSGMKYVETGAGPSCLIVHGSRWTVPRSWVFSFGECARMLIDGMVWNAKWGVLGRVY